MLFRYRLMDKYARLMQKLEIVNVEIFRPLVSITATQVEKAQLTRLVHIELEWAVNCRSAESSKHSIGIYKMMQLPLRTSAYTCILLYSSLTSASFVVLIIHCTCPRYLFASSCMILVVLITVNWKSLAYLLKRKYYCLALEL
ncbi:hypothetical protein RHGRI_029062 [Rhododendron griersonianum]|uniref:Uncharacterized protein n=1 Tax=Rhododendron griersonianum TaxID=479676 RepID=A0AAV6IK54_9ERIC|nr:hypothetical protein RHGRI_029062 [Rhododendron griersonianum]